MLSMLRMWCSNNNNKHPREGVVVVAHARLVVVLLWACLPPRPNRKPQKIGVGLERFNEIRIARISCRGRGAYIFGGIASTDGARRQLKVATDSKDA